MASNTTRQADEDTPLLLTDPESAQASPALSDGNNSSSFNSEEEDGTVQQLFQELEQAWPSTFQRSVSILASPVIRKEEALLYTRSPMPGSTPQILARRTTLRRGFYTPEPANLPPSASRQQRQNGDENNDDEDHDDGTTDSAFPLKLSRIKSMDWVKKKVENLGLA